jgi:amino acid adenylation domain-containing protein
MTHSVSSMRDFAPANLVELLRWRAAWQNDQRAYVFLRDGESEESAFTYGDLDRRARAIGARLQAEAPPGGRVLLVYPSCLEYIAAFFGCLYAGAVAVPAYLPGSGRADQQQNRLRSIGHDSSPSLVLTTSTMMARVRHSLLAGESSLDVPLIASDQISGELAGDWRDPGVHAESLAFLQYTSGSTSNPKGVMLSHGNILKNEQALQRAFHQTEQSIIAGWLPLYHDMGLIGNVLQTLYSGASCVLMSPAAFLQKPLRWLSAISSYRATTSGGPNFAYDLCVSRISPEDRKGLDLSSWQIAFNGAEPVRAETLDRFAEAFAPSGFRREAFAPCYGLAEASLMVSGPDGRSLPALIKADARALERGSAADPEAGPPLQRMVASGAPALDTTVLIVKPETLAECASREIGEIWVRSLAVARGYWNQPQKTEEIFHAQLADGRKGFLRTGDLGFMHEGQLFVTGRLRDLIIIRGQNHHPEDIEWTARECQGSPLAGVTAAFSVDDSGAERLVILQEAPPRGNLDIEAAMRAIRQAVAEIHGLQVYAIVLVKAGSIPRTSSGKIRRFLARESYLAGALDTVSTSVLEEQAAAVCDAPEQPAGDSSVSPEEYVTRVVKQILRVSEIPLDRPLTALGLDSLKASELKSRLDRDWSARIETDHLLDGWTVQDVANHLAKPVITTEIEEPSPSEFTAEYSLSYGQRALWTIYQQDKENLSYTLGRVLRIRGDLDRNALRAAFHAIVQKHPSLRAVFIMQGQQPFQRIGAAAELDWLEEDCAGLTAEDLDLRLMREITRPFDLERERPLRISLLARGPFEHLLVISVHHIAIDLFSCGIILRDLQAFYDAGRGGSPLQCNPAGLQYSDYVRWQSKMLQGQQGERLFEYWQKQLGGDLPLLELHDDGGSLHQQECGGEYHFRLDAELSRAAVAFAHSRGTILYVVLLAAFQSLLHRYTRQEDIVVGSPFSGRSHPHLDDLVGYLTNPLVLRSDFRGSPSFQELLNRARQLVMGAFAHQEFPFGLLADRLQPARAPGRTPFFQVMFVLQTSPSTHDPALLSLALNGNTGRIALGELTLELVPVKQGAAQFDLTLMMAEINGELCAVFKYGRRFQEARIERMAGHFSNLLRACMADPGLPIRDIPLLSTTEIRQILDAQNPADIEVGEASSIQELFEEQARRFPSAPAVVCGKNALTFSALNARANQVAHYLQRMKVRPDDLVGLCVDRSVEMIVALLGILKSGAAYVPLDPSLPKEYISSVVRESAISVLLADSAFAERFPDWDGTMVCMNESAFAAESQENPARPVSAQFLAYAIFTSGTTGTPKGILVQHASVLNLFAALLRGIPELQPHEPLRVALNAPLWFDSSVKQLVMLLAGQCLHVLPADLRIDSDKLVAYARSNQIDVLDCTPSHLKVLLSAGLVEKEYPRVLLIGGESIDSKLWAALAAAKNVCAYNVYGPTECTVDATACRVTEKNTIPSIGRALANVETFILDDRFDLVPEGWPGELHIGGRGVARAYLGDAVLTAQKFLPHPWSRLAGARLYKTGDLVRSLPDGTIEWLGRLDAQVKIRGFRVELGSIAATLRSHPNISDAFAIQRAGASGKARLIAYVILKPGGNVAVEELGSWLKGRLPEYMVPSAIVAVDSYPLRSSGKIDIAKLPEPDSCLRDGSAGAYVEPETALEKALAECWIKLLGVEQVGLYDSFFALGGDSLLATQLASRLQEVFPTEAPLLTVFFENPTVAALAKAISEGGSGEMPREKIDDSLRGVEAVLAGSLD